jgi:hypothetical protein
MVYRGRMHNGAVVFVTPPPLPEGTEVVVEAAADAGAPRGTAEALRRIIGGWAGDQEEFEGLLAEVQRMRDEDTGSDLTI